jgi:hypothetical protein
VKFVPRTVHQTMEKNKNIFLLKITAADTFIIKAEGTLTLVGFFLVCFFLVLSFHAFAIVELIFDNDIRQVNNLALFTFLH